MRKSFKSLGLIAIAIAISGIQSCDKCSGEQPRARVVNNGTASVSVQIKTSGGNTENINNVASKSTSDFRSYAAGDVTYTISVGKADFVKTVSMSECYEYDITIDEKNNITSVPTDRNK